MWKLIPIVSLLLLFEYSPMGQVSSPVGKASQPPQSASPSIQSTVPAEAKNMINPVKPTPGSLDQAKKFYGYDCAMCHGANGNGKGDIAVDQGLKLADFTDPAVLNDIKDGEIFYIIKNGKGTMPGEEGRAKPDQIWGLVNYLRTLPKK